VDGILGILGTFTACKWADTIAAMPTKDEPSPRIIIPLSRELLERIDDFRYEHRIPSRAEAIRQLIEAGLRAKRAPKPHKPS
jgi:hypothetical protein